MLRKYIILTKPGIIFGNLITAIAGFFLASKGVINAGIFIAMIVGLSLIIASACVCNNILDRRIDAKMERTKKRALVNGTVSTSTAILYAVILGGVGTFLLLQFTNGLTYLVALCGFIIYVFIYGYWKRRSDHGTFVGSFAGATPPVVGYVSVSNQFDAAALILFVMLVCWQMPHFFAIAMFRKKDYQKAQIPVMPIIRGNKRTIKTMIIYSAAYLVASFCLFIFGYASLLYALIAAALGIYWLHRIVQGLKATDNIKWARGVFKISLIVITVISITIAFDATISGKVYNPNMIILVHILAALASIASATFLYISPTKFKLQLSYLLFTATIASGTVLVLSLHTNMLRTCLIGLTYIFAMAVAVLAARFKLAAQENQQ